MTSPGDGGLAYWREHREQLRQSENQRAVLTNFVLVIAAAVSSLVVQQHFAVRTLPLSVLVVITGVYGALTAAKYHERADYHLQQARALTAALTVRGSWRTTGARWPTAAGALPPVSAAAPDPAAPAVDRTSPGHRRLRRRADHHHALAG